MTDHRYVHKKTDSVVPRLANSLGSYIHMTLLECNYVTIKNVSVTDAHICAMIKPTKLHLSINAFPLYKYLSVLLFAGVKELSSQTSS